MNRTSPELQRDAIAKRDRVFQRFLTKMTSDDLVKITNTHARANLISEFQAARHRDEFLEFLAISNFTDKNLPRSDNVIAFWYSIAIHAQQYDEASKLHSDEATNSEQDSIEKIIDRLITVFVKAKSVMQDTKSNFIKS